MTERELTPRAAEILARLAVDADWTRSGLDEAFARLIPAKAMQHPSIQPILCDARYSP